MNTVKVVCIADLQGMCGEIAADMLPVGDVLLIAGDLAGWGTLSELEEVDTWLGGLPYKYKVIIGGNHDQALRRFDGHEVFKNGIYLQDEAVNIMGLNIYGTPLNEMNQYRYTSDWVYCDSMYIREAADKIPTDIDILITHGPAYGFTDKVANGQSVGSRELRDAVLKQKPRYVVCGHIHEAHGIEEWFGTTFVNAAICSRSNELFNNGQLYYEPIVLEVSVSGHTS